MVHARFDSDTKASVSAALAAIGLSTPNAESCAAMAELEAGKGKRFKATEALFDDLGI